MPDHLPLVVAGDSDGVLVVQASSNLSSGIGMGGSSALARAASGLSDAMRSLSGDLPYSCCKPNADDEPHCRRLGTNGVTGGCMDVFVSGKFFKRIGIGGCP